MFGLKILFYYLYFYRRSRAQSSDESTRQRNAERQKTGEFLLSRFLKKVHLIYGYSYKHLLSIEKAERLNARLILLFAVQIDFYA